MEEFTYSLQLLVTGTERIATDAVKVHLRELHHKPVLYEAGQYLTFLLRLYKKEFRRSYSLVTSPGIDHDLAIVVKRQTNGEISRYIYDHLKTGEVLTSLFPTGRFTFSSSAFQPQTLFFVAAGSGISPVFSLLKDALYHHPLLHVILLYQSRDEASTIFHAELLSLRQNFDQQFTYIQLLSDPAGKQAVPQRLNNMLLEQLILAQKFTKSSSIFYVCGPESFMRMATFVLKYMGFGDDQLRKENFVIHSIPPAPVLPDATSKNIRLRWRKQEFHFSVSYPQNILQAALNNHIQLPYSCRGGKCSACTVKCISGKIIMSINEVLTTKDLEDGYRLTCVGYAETDLDLELM